MGGASPLPTATSTRAGDFRRPGLRGPGHPPGVWVLSENAHFAALCRKNGLVFIGPTPESMEQLSDKAKLKRGHGENGLAVIPGTQVLASAQEALAAGAKIGYPVMLKASSQRGRPGASAWSPPPTRWPRPTPWPWRRGRPPRGRVGVHGKVRPPRPAH